MANWKLCSCEHKLFSVLCFYVLLFPIEFNSATWSWQCWQRVSGRAKLYLSSIKVSLCTNKIVKPKILNQQRLSKLRAQSSRVPIWLEVTFLLNFLLVSAIWADLPNCVKSSFLSQAKKACFVACAWWKSYEKLKYQSLGELFITFSKTYILYFLTFITSTSYEKLGNCIWI